MPPLTPTPTSPGGPKQMPKWAWPVAIGGGLLIGFFLLRKPGEEYEDEQDEDSAAPEGQRRGGGGGGAPPLDEQLLEAFGLTPPTEAFEGNGTGDSGFSDDGGGSADQQQLDNASFGTPTGTGSALSSLGPGGSWLANQGYVPTSQVQGSKATGPGYTPGGFQPAPAPDPYLPPPVYIPPSTSGGSAAA